MKTQLKSATAFLVVATLFSHVTSQCAAPADEAKGLRGSVYDDLGKPVPSAIRLRKAPGAVAGKVVDAQGKPVVKARVVMGLSAFPMPSPRRMRRAISESTACCRSRP
jgi:hypothetical protein